MARHPDIRGSATIRQVAERARVSKSSVSRYLQDPSRVSASARHAIAEAIAELDYRPSAAARSLTRRQSEAIGVLIHDLRQPWFVDFLDALAQVLHESGYSMLMCDTRLDGSMGESLISAFAQRQVDGIVLAGTMPVSQRLVEAIRSVPTVVAGNHEFDDSSLDVVIPDDAAAARLAMTHLYGLGHRRIAHVRGPSNGTFDIRARTYEEFMAEHDIASHAAVVPSDSTAEGGRAAALDLFARRAQPPTAVFASNDLAAIGVLSAAKDLGIACPEDLSVVGIDDSYLAALPPLNLTSVGLSTAAQGRFAGQMIVERIAEPNASRRIETLPPGRLSVRGSTGNAR
ncbi:LacI family DNA-binding transcriptional regulator [Actinomyces oricola]|uniref:LacI family DNA-binding transcriptional regulator n=1 Tax=Actinomyces oricola TaxID=206043 RepID=UPI000FFE4B60|nr:LacI family DNA-binding transcriptional regulator [Actinomyces oricola]